MFNIRLITHQDYEMVCSWWDKYEMAHFPFEMLPKAGLICYDEIQDVCAGYIYRDPDSKICWIGWYVRDKDYEGNPKKAMDFLVKALKEYARALGYQKAISVINKVSNKSLVDTLIRNGGKPGDSNAVEILMEL